MSEPPKTVTEEYFRQQEKYTQEYGPNAVLFTRIGDFYEAYATATRGFDLDRVHDISDLTKSRKNKNKEMSDRNPCFVGFGPTSFHKYVKKMINGGLDVVIIDQITSGKNPKRELTGIYSAGTYIDDETTDFNSTVSIYIEYERQMNNQYLMCIGFAVIDVNTGSCSVGEFCSKPDDEKYALDEVYRLLISFQPKKILITSEQPISNKIKEMTKDELYEYLELEDLNIEYFSNVDSLFKKSHFQNEFLGEIYPKLRPNMMSHIENIDMEHMTYARLSLIILFKHMCKYNKLFVNNISPPQIIQNKNNLLLGNNAVYQLNLLENTSLEYKGKFKSIFDVVNNTSTQMGRRYLKYSLCRPITDITEINRRYECVNELIQNGKNSEGKLYLEFEEHLKCIGDIEKLYRKIVQKIAHPYEFYNILTSVILVKELYLKCLNYKHLSYYIPKKKILNLIDSFIEEYNGIFLLSSLQRQKNNDITDSFF